MKLAVIQHRIRENLDADIEALADSIRRACELQAAVVVCPLVFSIAEAGQAGRERLLSRLAGCPEGTALLIPFRTSAGETVPGLSETPLGPTALLLGDECISPEVTVMLDRTTPAAVVMRPLAEGELQAEAVLELALGLSASVSGLVIISECFGAEIGEPGHGSSAVMLLGEVVAEASESDEILLVDVDAPLPAPEPREPLPELPPILEQRLAHHQGRKPEPGYLADLS